MAIITLCLRRDFIDHQSLEMASSFVLAHGIYRISSSTFSYISLPDLPDIQRCLFRPGTRQRKMLFRPGYLTKKDVVQARLPIYKKDVCSGQVTPTKMFVQARLPDKETCLFRPGPKMFVCSGHGSMVGAWGGGCCD